ncbi:DMT family transporter [Aquabacterium sp. J223]|uniref:DMT family transporter n=1 Tax=Aquabacterium sp. J223 TaxID=2898431 RepID=UPI0021AD8C61|nr:DMT family transporter [Aquabacterium sp. J223]UUX97824.1 DMT family transporter [Aquabacterium sp. J223]
MPAVFVLIWSTGFIVARYGMPHAPPLGFLSLRYGLSAVCLLLWVVASRAPLPSGRAAWWHLAVTGVLMQAGYLGGVWAAVKHGMPAGTIALIVGLQPVLTAVWVSGRGTGRVSPRQWLGLVLGFAGLALVVGRQLDGGRLHALNLSLAVLALASITVGTLYQKHFVGPTDVRSAGLLQMVAALAVTAPLALLESGGMDWHPEMVGALVWSVLGLTLGGSSLLFLLIQRGAATEVTSLLYLVPPCVAVEAWLLFGETLTPAMLAGLAMAAVGVALVVRPAAAAVPPAAG